MSYGISVLEALYYVVMPFLLIVNVIYIGVNP